MHETDTNVIIGRIALSAGMIGASQLSKLIARIRKGGPMPTAEELLLKAGFITPVQAGMLRRMRQNLFHRRGGGTSLFGQMAVAHKFVTPEQLATARRRQAELERAGQFRPLGEVMADLGFIGADQISKILDLQKRRLMNCAVCGRSYHVSARGADKVRCPQCLVPLMAPKAAEQAISPAEATLIAEKSTMAAPKIAEDGPADRLIGTSIGGCKIVQHVGRGAMGTVYRGRHLTLGRPVAIKLVPAGGQDQFLVRRLLFEARSIAKLSHPNIVQVYDAGLSEAYLYLVMEFVDGAPLDKALKEQGPLPEARAIELARGMLKGLSAAHKAGIVHRDLKPANVMLDPEGRPKLMDFGLARDRAKQDEVADTVVGTPYYMAPEQWLCKPVDERTDLYALGLILYQMLAGRRPFDAPSVRELMEMHLKQAAPPLRQFQPTLSKGVVAVVKKAIAKGPARRYADAADFGADLARVERGEEPEAMAQFARTVKCGFCDALNPEGSRLCAVCKEPIGAKQAELTLMARANEFRCPGCKGFVPLKTRACPHCSRAFCRRCLRRLAAADGLCARCQP
jgi:hypothetical protein